jgi:hypothetical protein
MPNSNATQLPQAKFISHLVVHQQDSYNEKKQRLKLIFMLSSAVFASPGFLAKQT